MGAFRYHMHIVDGGDPTSTVTAATLFAHLTLRCGQLRNYLLLSASTTDAKRQGGAHLTNFTATRNVQLPALEPSPGDSTDDNVLLAAAAVLYGDKEFRDDFCVDAESRASIAAVKDRIIPYPCFGCGFVESEVFLTRSGGRYFDFIATADVASFNYLLNYYQAVRMMGNKGEGQRQGILKHVESQQIQKGQRHNVGIVHILCGEPARAGHLLQRFIEMLLETDTKSGENNEVESEGSGDNSTWVNRVDGVISRMHQLLGVDILFMLA